MEVSDTFFSVNTENAFEISAALHQHSRVPALTRAYLDILINLRLSVPQLQGDDDGDVYKTTLA